MGANLGPLPAFWSPIFPAEKNILPEAWHAAQTNWAGSNRKEAGGKSRLEMSEDEDGGEDEHLVESRCDSTEKKGEMNVR